MWAMKLGSAIGNYMYQNKLAESRRLWTKYNNKMAHLQAGIAQDAITDNVALNAVQHAENKMLIKTSKLMTAAKVKAGAAAMGQAGGSVEATLFDVGRNAAVRLAQEDEAFRTSIMVTNQQRKSTAMSAQMAQQTAPEGPSLGSALLGAGLNILGDAMDTPTSSGTMLEGGSESPTSGWDKLREHLMI